MNTKGRRKLRGGSVGWGRVFLLAALSLTCVSAQAADKTWTGAQNNLWFNSGNWIGSLPGDNDTAVFDDTATFPIIVLQGLQATFDKVRFDSPDQYVITQGSMIFGDLSSLGAGTVVTHAIDANLNLYPNATWTISDIASVAVLGQFNTDGGLTKAGNGTLLISGNNNGVPGNLSIMSGEVQLLGGSAYSDADAIHIGENGTLSLDENETIGGLSGNGTVELGDQSLTLQGNLNTIFSGTINGDDDVQLKMDGTGTQTFSGYAEVGGFDATSGRFIIDGGSFVMPELGHLSFTLTGTNAEIEVRNGGTVQMPILGGVSNPQRLWINEGAQMSITGAGSQLVTSRADIGSQETGSTLIVSDHALLDVTLGTEPVLVVAVTSSTNVNGLLSVQSGGSVICPRIDASLYESQVGMISVQGQDSSIDTDFLSMGGIGPQASGGAGHLTITDGGIVTVSNLMQFWSDSSSVSIDGGVLSVDRLMAFDDHRPTMELSDSSAGSALILGTNDSSSAISFEISDAAGGPGSIRKLGAGILTLAYGGTYSGGITVTDGTLRLQDAARKFASLSGTGPVTMMGTRIDGTGAIAGALSIGGNAIVSPSTENGNGIGVIECGSVSFDAGTTLQIELGGSSDQLFVDGIATLGGTLEFSYTSGFTASPGDWFEIIAAGDVAGDFDSVVWPDGQDWVTYQAGGSLYVGLCGATSVCMAECLEETEVYGPRTSAGSVVGNNEIVVLNRQSAGIEIVDATNPTLGPALATIPVNVFTPHNVKGLALDGSTLAIAGGVPRLFDISFPDDPFMLSTLNGYNAFDVAIKGDLLAVALTDGLGLFDINDPFSPSLFSFTPTAPFGSSGTVTFHDGLLFWSWQDDEFTIGDMYILDVSNPSSPVQLGSISAAYFSSEPQFKDNIMFLSSDQGVRAIDISDVTSPTEVDSKLLPGTRQELALSGGLLYRVSNLGLTVIDVTDPTDLNVIDNLEGFSDAKGITSFDSKLWIVGDSGLSVVAAGDIDGDGTTDLCDPCEGDQLTGDTDADGICDDIDPCPTSPDNADGDDDGVADGCDCDAENGDVYPGNTETICDGIDNDCDAATLDNPGGVCDVQAPASFAVGPRYIEVTPHAASVPVALAITSADAPCLAKYIDFDSDQDLAALGIAMLVDAPVYRTPDEWGTLNVRGLEIVPNFAYEVRVESEGAVIVASADSTVTHGHGDVDDNGVANFADIQSVVLGFQGQWGGSIGAVDLAPCVPNGIVNFEDIQQAVLAFQNQAFDLVCELPCAGGVASLTNEPTSPVTLLLSTEADHAVAGDVVHVDVWTTEATDLHTYQVAIEAIDQHGHEFLPSVVAIDIDHEDFVFGDDEVISAMNLSDGLFGASTLGYGRYVESAGARYLATVSFEIPRDARGKWQFRIVEGDATLALDSAGRSMPVAGTDLLIRVEGASRKNRSSFSGR